MTPAGIEPATFRFVAQLLNHCATAVPRTIDHNETKWSFEVAGALETEKWTPNKRLSPVVMYLHAVYLLAWKNAACR